MRFDHTRFALSVIAVLCACTAVQEESSDASPQHELASARIPEPSAAVARAQVGELGEVVQDLSESLWIVFQDKQNRYWFGSDGEGVYRVDGSHILRSTTKDGLCNDHVRQILEDASGDIYINTCGGISKFDGKSFSTVVPTTSTASASEWKSEPGDLWFKGNNGPFRYDGESLHRLEFPRHEREGEWRSKFPKVPYSPYDTYIIYNDSKGSIWFGTACFGVCRFDGDSFTWVSEKEMIEFDNGPSVGIRGIVEDKDGKFWFSHTSHRYDVYPADATAQAPSAAKYRKEPGIQPSEANTDPDYSYFVSGVKGRDDALWLATYGAGVWRYDGANLSSYPVAEGKKTALLYSIYEDNAGVLWLGSTNSGAFRFNGKAFERFRP